MIRMVVSVITGSDGTTRTEGTDRMLCHRRIEAASSSTSLTLDRHATQYGQSPATRQYAEAAADEDMIALNYI